MRPLNSIAFLASFLINNPENKVLQNIDKWKYTLRLLKEKWREQFVQLITTLKIAAVTSNFFLATLPFCDLLTRYTYFFEHLSSTAHLQDYNLYSCNM